MHDDNRSSSDPAARASRSTAGTPGDDAPAFSPWQDASDGDLILYTRAGDGSAYGELWRRHARAGRTVARSFTSSLDPDDLVQESFAKIYQALQKGGGPTGAFRPYLFTTIRNTASAWGRARREASIDTLESFEDPASRDEETMAALDRSLTATAFRSLPTRWQEVLWYCEVEQMTPQQVAPLLAMKPNAVAALAYRAREGLRQAWIQAHIAAVPEGSEHRWTIERIGSYTRGSLGKRDTGKIEDHLDSCARCTIVAAEAREVGSRIALVLLPLAAGTAGATGYLAWMQTGSHAALTTAAMPASVIGGHGMSLGTPIDPTVLSSVASSAAGGGAAGSGAAGSGAAGSGTAGATAASTGAATSAATVSAGAVTTGIMSAAIALVAAGAVAATLALSPTATVPLDDSLAGGDSISRTVAPSDGDDESSAPSGGQTTAPTESPAPADSPSAAPTPDPTSPDRTTATPTMPTAPTEKPDAPTDPVAPVEPDPVDPDPVDPDPVDPEPSLPNAPVVNMIDQGEGEALYPVVQGWGDDGSTVTIRRGDEVLAELTSSEDGGWWMSDPLTSLPVGESEISIEQTVDGRTSLPVVQTITVREAPSVLNLRDGSILFATDLDITLGAAFPGAFVAGSVDGLPMFTCRYDESGTASTCAWNDDTWPSLGFGFHTIRVAYADDTGREGVPREITVFVPLTGSTDRAESTSDEPTADGPDGHTSETGGGDVPPSGSPSSDPVDPVMDADDPENPAEESDPAATEDPTTENPATDDAATEDPATQDPATEDPANTEPTSPDDTTTD